MNNTEVRIGEEAALCLTSDYSKEVADIELLIRRGELRRELFRALDSLNHKREKEVLVSRFGLNEGIEKTLASIGRRFGISGGRIAQVESKALRKVRHPSRSSKLREFFWSVEEIEESKADEFRKFMKDFADKCKRKIEAIEEERKAKLHREYLKSDAYKEEVRQYELKMAQEAVRRKEIAEAQAKSWDAQCEAIRRKQQDRADALIKILRNVSCGEDVYADKNEYWFEETPVGLVLVKRIVWLAYLAANQNAVENFKNERVNEDLVWEHVWHPKKNIVHAQSVFGRKVGLVIWGLNIQRPVRSMRSWQTWRDIYPTFASLLGVAKQSLAYDAANGNNPLT